MGIIERLPVANAKEDRQKKFQDHINLISEKVRLPHSALGLTEPVSFSFKYNEGKVTWTITAKQDVGYLSGYLHFYSGKRRVSDRTWNVSRLKAGETISDSTPVDVWELTRIDGACPDLVEQQQEKMREGTEFILKQMRLVGDTSEKREKYRDEQQKRIQNLEQYK